ncbi:penicillin-insensitive murein endopeptidase [Bradyrhizobium sp.]|uniref:penicillin-insensitive murein endopeptidase n=1 Tax=Bradyrhizobium sp. TaxID=376 RepID=UPI003C33FF70
MHARRTLIPLLAAIAAAAASLALSQTLTRAMAQDKGSVEPKPLPPLANPNDPKIAAKELFARRLLPTARPTRVIGAYSDGCIAGAAEMPITGDTWQVMRLSRNRNWGHPDMVALLQRLAAKAHKDAGWPGILVGDMGQPRGGPALSGHASHQIGLDADVWLTPMPDHLLSREEREETSATMMVRDDRLDIDPKVFTPGHVAVIRDAAMEPSVQRIFVNAAIKKALCREASGDRSWLSKVRPWYGHDYHFHIRMRCPQGSSECKGQKDQEGGDGCKPDDLAYWFKESILHPEPPKEPEQPAHGITLAQMPADCRAVLNAADAKPSAQASTKLP